MDIALAAKLFFSHPIFKQLGPAVRCSTVFISALEKLTPWFRVKFVEELHAAYDSWSTLCVL